MGLLGKNFHCNYLKVTIALLELKRIWFSYDEQTYHINFYQYISKQILIRLKSFQHSASSKFEYSRLFPTFRILLSAYLYL